MDLNTYGLQCLTAILTAVGVMLIVLVVLIGVSRLLGQGIETPDEVE